MFNRSKDAAEDDGVEKKKRSRNKLTPEQKAIRNKQKVERAAAAQVRRAESQVKKAEQSVQDKEKNDEKKQKEKAKKAANKIKTQEKKEKEKQKRKEQQAAAKLKKQEAKAQRKAELEARTPLQKRIDRALLIKKFLPLIILVALAGSGTLAGWLFGPQISQGAKSALAMVPFLSGGGEKEEEHQKKEEHEKKDAHGEKEEAVKGINVAGNAIIKKYVIAALAGYMDVEEKEAKGFCSTVNFSDGYKELIAGKQQIFFGEAPTDKETELAAEAGFGLKAIPILNGGLVFLINEENPVKDLTLAQIQGIYDGSITNWKELGGEDIPILAYQRKANTGGQKGMYQYVLAADKMAKAPRKMKLSTTEKVAEAVAAEKGAIGYTYYYYVNELESSEGIELAAIDSVEPDDDTIASGQYPLITYTYAVVTLPKGQEEAGSPADSKEGEEAPTEEEIKAAQKERTQQLEQLRANLQFIQWILQEDGQTLAVKKGFVDHQN